LGTAKIHLRKFVREHKRRVADPELGVADLALTHRYAHHLARTESVLVKIDRRCRAPYT
jgi:hypothetical protein